MATLRAIEHLTRPLGRLSWPQITNQVRADLHSEQIILLPVRVFIGLGWLRAGVEKLIDPAWLDGTSLAAFLTTQIGGGHVVFPFYEALMHALFLPYTPILSWIVLIGQLLAGVAIMTGCCTRAALIGGLFMNLNFLLAGVPNPSAFYLVIQMVLLLANTGAIMGVDSWLGRVISLAWLTARPPALSALRRFRVWSHLLAMLIYSFVVGISATYISDFSPAGSVRDPAMILTILAVMATFWAGLSYLRSVIPPNNRATYVRPAGSAFEE